MMSEFRCFSLLSVLYYRFALECAVRSLTFYSKFFNLPYPLAKYDMIAIPDFSSGAMENWGLVLYRESCILVDPANSSQSSKQWVAIVVCHETAHQVPNRNG